MDADPDARLKKMSRREKRWSMNSQRLDEIVAELMKPISDVRRNFDTDLSALLEAYLTEAGLHALEAGEEGNPEVKPNYAEIALLLQQSANIYSRKVEFLYQDVLKASSSLNNTIIEENIAEEVEQTSSGTGRRKGARLVGFESIEIERASGASRESVPRPPPTLPRMYIELEPRQLTDADWQLLDRVREPIGLLADFHVAWRLQGGFLVEDLEAGPLRVAARALKDLLSTTSLPPPLSLPQLNTPSPSSSPLLPLSPFNCSTPLPVPLKRERKRRIDVSNEDDDSAKLLISEEVISKLRCGEFKEFSLPERWIRRVVDQRSREVLSNRALARSADKTEFYGWDTASAQDVGGFRGWTAADGHTSLTELKLVRPRVDESEDDGFFEQSSYSDCDPRHSPVHAVPSTTHPCAVGGEEPEWYKWRERVLSRSTEVTPDVQQTASQLLNRLSETTAVAPSIDALLKHQHRVHGTHPAHLTLAALFLANSGNIEIVQGEPLTVNSFSIKLLSTDASLYRPAIARDNLS